ncbi:MAG: hypothetical protein LBB98_15530 [Treponema sp.]|nr:hypothetical protein [Treponema sp.]
MEKVKLDEDYYGEDWISIDVLDQWLEKARDYLNQRNYHEAVLAAQACIEEFAYWQENSDSDISELVYDGYQSEPFEVLTGAARSQEVNIRELFDYCMKEMPKKKYAGTMAYDNFNDLLLELLKAGKEELNAGAFISLQNSLLESVTDKSSYEAQKILQREIDYYKSRHKYKKAWEIIEENIQIVAFRRMLVEKKIEQRDYDAAKKLIYDFVNADPKRERHPSEWDDFLLTIAKEEKDTPALRKISRICIDDYFRADYFPLYKSTFTDGEWAEAMEDLITYYKNKTRGFSSSVADVLTAGNVAERLLEYIEKYPFIENLDKYYTVFAKAFPEKTLALFRKSVDRYAESNTGRTSYEHIAELLRKMTEIPNGGAVVTGMINEYRTRYKIRRAMVEVLDRVQKNLDLLRTDPRSSFV